MSVILSFDVGIINLAYCLFTKEDNKLKILDWNIINLTNRESTKCYCGLKASFSQGDKYFCKVHAKKCEPIKSFEELFKPNNENKCTCLVKDIYCGRKSVYNINTNDNINYYCTTHAKTTYKLLTTQSKVKLFKNKSVSTMDFDNTRLKLFQKLDEKKELLKADIILIENQPSIKNPTMKSIATGLYDFYMIRGLLDKVDESNIKIVKFMSPSNKLKLVDDGQTKQVVIYKAESNESKAYKLTKELSVKYTKELITDMPEWTNFLNNQKKKDDLADALLQGLYYYEKHL
jgi:hypothetical protein